jgi:hypothetical protein
MIVESTVLAGIDAYLRDTSGSVELASNGGKTPQLEPGTEWGIHSLHIRVTAHDLRDRFGRESAFVLQIAVVKELFPDLFADPYAHRVHAISGFEDFRRGRMQHVDALEVDGVPTLVALESGTPTWQSARYDLPRPVRLAAAGWTMPVSRRADDLFRYTLTLAVWPAGAQAAAPLELTLANRRAPRDMRAAQPLAGIPAEVVAWQLRLEADVDVDLALAERHHAGEGAPFGPSLLDGIYLLESVASPLVFNSLQELLAAATEHHCFTEPDGRLTQVLVRLPLAATLGAGETIRLEAANGRFDSVQAFLSGRVSMRPPVPEQAR